MGSKRKQIRDQGKENNRRWKQAERKRIEKRQQQTEQKSIEKRGPQRGGSRKRRM